MGSSTEFRKLNGPLYPLGYEQISSLGSAVGLTVPTDAVLALITVESSDVRWRDDGVDPTATVGMVIAADDELFYIGVLSSIKFIGAGAVVNVSYYR